MLLFQFYINIKAFKKVTMACNNMSFFSSDKYALAFVESSLTSLPNGEKNSKMNFSRFKDVIISEIPIPWLMGRFNEKNKFETSKRFRSWYYNHEENNDNDSEYSDSEDDDDDVDVDDDVDAKRHGIKVTLKPSDLVFFRIEQIARVIGENIDKFKDVKLLSFYIELHPDDFIHIERISQMLPKLEILSIKGMMLLYKLYVPLVKSLANLPVKYIDLSDTGFNELMVIEEMKPYWEKIVSLSYIMNGAYVHPDKYYAVHDDVLKQYSVLLKEFGFPEFIRKIGEFNMKKLKSFQ